MLAQAGYRELTMPLSVSNVPFDFAAAFIGGERSLDLVVIVDMVLADKNERRLVQKFQSLSRALDLAEFATLGDSSPSGRRCQSRHN